MEANIFQSAQQLLFGHSEIKTASTGVPCWRLPRKDDNHLFNHCSHIAKWVKKKTQSKTAGFGSSVSFYHFIFLGGGSTFFDPQPHSDINIGIESKHIIC